MEYEILEYLKTCANVIGKPVVPYIQFVEFLYKQAEASKNNPLMHVVHNHTEKLVPFLEILINKRECILIKDSDGIKAIFVFQTAIQLIMKKYEQLEYGYSEVFPSMESLEFKLPQDSVTIIHIKEDFVKLISNTEQSNTPVINIIFPYNIDNIIITKNLINTKLIKYAVYIIKNYFQGQMNIEFVYNKFVTIFKGSEIALSDMLKALITKPGTALQSLVEPNYFSFKFWAHLANLVLENLKEKAGKLTKEHGYCQAAFIIGYYIVYQKGIVQKEKQKKMDLKKIDARLKKDPYVYTLKEIYGFIDKSGIPFIKKYSKKLIDNYLNKLTAYHGDIDSLPEIVCIMLQNHTEYYIHKESIISLFSTLIEDAAQTIKNDLQKEWTYYYKNFIKDKAMTFDFAFLIEVEKKVKERFPLLYALINNNLLLLVRKDPDIADAIKKYVNRYLNEHNKLYELDLLLKLDRIELLQEVKSSLPAYYTLPVISLIVHFFKWVLGKKENKKKKNENKTQKNGYHSSPTQYGHDNNEIKDKSKTHTPETRKRLSLADYTNAIAALKDEIVGKGKSMDTSLKILAEKWNPLIDPRSKADLVEDVNSLTRDFLRSLRKGFHIKPPDAARIKNLAKELSEKKALEKITRKEYLVRYIEIYMINCLQSLQDL